MIWTKILPKYATEMCQIKRNHQAYFKLHLDIWAIMSQNNDAQVI